jgi:GDPmannose 4,6-dehydratase
MVQAEVPDTFVLATNRTETVREFATLAFQAADIDIEWSGQAEQEIGRDVKTGNVLVRVDPAFYRPAEVELLIGNPQKAYDELGWKAEVTLESLCEMMVLADLHRNEAGDSR